MKPKRASLIFFHGRMECGAFCFVAITAQ